MTNISSITAYMKNMKGFSLIELVVALAVISIAIAVGLPSLQGISQDSRLTSAINTLSGDFAFARSEAVTRNVSVRIRTVTADNNWAGGWIVETLPAVGPAVTIRNGPALANNILLTGDAPSLTYNSDGTQTVGTLNFKSCKNGDVTAHGREVRVIPTGRIKLVKNQPCP